MPPFVRLTAVIATRKPVTRYVIKGLEYEWLETEVCIVILKDNNSDLYSVSYYAISTPSPLRSDEAACNIEKCFIIKVH